MEVVEMLAVWAPGAQAVAPVSFSRSDLVEWAKDIHQRSFIELYRMQVKPRCVFFYRELTVALLPGLPGATRVGMSQKGFRDA